jgi:HTH-type transcriptional repressor of NAD biosynthesis genes
MSKKYAVGMYGGKFMPMHIGHLRCLKIASEECEHVYCILFYGGDQEDKAHADSPKDNSLSLDSRIKQLYRACQYFDNVTPVVLDISKCRNEDGSENWEAETPLVREAIGHHLDAVYGSEPSYGEYFSNAYPYAVYRCLDPERKHIHISGTELRNMPYAERKEWMV